MNGWEIRIKEKQFINKQTIADIELLKAKIQDRIDAMDEKLLD